MPLHRSGAKSPCGCIERSGSCCELAIDETAEHFDLTDWVRTNRVDVKDGHASFLEDTEAFLDIPLRPDEMRCCAL